MTLYKTDIYIYDQYPVDAAVLYTANGIYGLVQERCNSSALAMELRLSCTNPSI